ncbi:MAG: EAL domain-containing protein, partial [Nitrospirota bacterium]|nr:EAL domain-containing protein [Nitrospirota bacterium]
CAVGASAQVSTTDKGSFEFYSRDLNAKSYERLKLEAELRQAIQVGDQLLLHYQPKVDVKNGRITGVETLMRWRQPDGTVKFPDYFIPLAEETGLIKPIGDWVLNEACAQLARWQAQGVWIQVAVNISAKQFHDDTLVYLVSEILKRHGVKGEYLTLEMTETLLMDDAEHTIKTLKQLMALGVKISMDDFGTGYSSLSYLKQFPIHELKIDRSFLMGISENSEDKALVAAMIFLAHEFNLKVVAEGVETQEQLELLLHLDCEEYQGYYFSRPITAQDLAPMLADLSHGPPA